MLECFWAAVSAFCLLNVSARLLAGWLRACPPMNSVQMVKVVTRTPRILRYNVGEKLQPYVKWLESKYLTTQKSKANVISKSPQVNNGYVYRYRIPSVLPPGTEIFYFSENLYYPRGKSWYGEGDLFFEIDFRVACSKLNNLSSLGTMATSRIERLGKRCALISLQVTRVPKSRPRPRPRPQWALGPKSQWRRQQGRREGHQVGRREKVTGVGGGGWGDGWKGGSCT